MAFSLKQIRSSFGNLYSRNKFLQFFLGSKAIGNSSFGRAHWLYGRALGIVILLAFISYWSQADALIGPDGLNPWIEDLDKIESLADGEEDLWGEIVLRPTLLWFSPFANHHLLFALGSLAALALGIGFLPLLSGLLCYLCYLSLMVVGEPFLSFQWDVLLVETLLLSLPFLPTVRLHRISQPIPHSRLARLLIVALLAKLMLESGIVKFTFFDQEGSNTWRDFTALEYHYWTQPLPHTLSSWIHSLPQWFDEFSLLTMYAVELILPPLLFFPGNIRRFALLGQVLLQFAILLSGNYGFFNLLTLVLCIPLCDDRMIAFFTREKLKVIESKPFPKVSLNNGCAIGLWALFLATGWKHLAQDLRGNQPADQAVLSYPKKIDDLQGLLRPFRSFNSYGLFRVMTQTRPEIIVETSTDAREWEVVRFSWKPSAPTHPPRFAGPHMPRIDWQMWFEGLNFERYAAHPFSRFLYGRFLELSARGAKPEDFSNVPKVLGDRETKALSQAPPQAQRQALANYNHLMNSFLSRSLWFGRFLEAITKGNETILAQLHKDSQRLTKPNFLRVSLHHYEFSYDEQKAWVTEPIPHASYVFNLKESSP